MKKYLLLFSIAALFSIIFIACEDDSTGPDPIGDVGRLNIQSTPPGATVFINNVNRGTTNTVINNVPVGNSVPVRLELAGYRDTSFTVVIVKDQETLKAVTLTFVPPTLTKHGPVRIWESFGTTSANPSGLDLSAGVAVSSSNTNADLYYFTTSGFGIHELRPTSSRNTSFFIGAGTNLEDTVDSPLAVSSWLDAVSDGENNYFFAFDPDLHYSKCKIVAISPNTEIPAWVEIEWYYNETANDRRFGDNN